ncbi:hypothetical protein ACIBCA_22775 [Kitasatospora sp. NPDC051170]|uniref:hypothetical protein n=1 Tax=Kitasatospora sp. NPDC051170 TaxID=3364056 RepID=UPI0037A400E3
MSWSGVGVGREPEDVRVVLAALSEEAKDGLRYDAVPWERFSHWYGTGSDVPGLLETIRLGSDVDSDTALGTLWNRVCHQGTTSAVGALTVPFLIRLALAHSRHRAGLLGLVGSVARGSNFGDTSRDALLCADGPREAGYYEPSGGPLTWTLQAGRAAAAADADILLHLLDDPEPAVRRAAAFALAIAHPAGRIPDGLHARLAVEDDQAVRACLVLAIGQLAREQHAPAAAEQLRAWWRDTTRPDEVRVSAGLAWLCLVEDDVPDELHELFATLVTDELTALLTPVPWLSNVHDEYGLPECVQQLCHPELPSRHSLAFRAVGDAIREHIRTRAN